MDKSINLCTHLIILGVLICLTTAASVRHKRNVIAEYKWPEPDPSVDHFPHETSCHHYYLVLSEDDITVNKCPHGELFDYIEHQCKEKKSAHCWSRHFGKTKHHHIALKSRGSFTCPYAWGKYPDINDCTRYYACLSGKVKHKKCAPFEHFDKISRKCVAAIDGVCADKTDVVERDFKCPRNWGSFSFHKDCSKYYECLEKKPNLRTCPIDTLFHERKGRCLPQNHVHCGSRHNPYSKKDETLSTAEVSISKTLPTTSSELRKSSIESEAVSSVMISSKAETNREEVQSGNKVSQTPQPPKNSTTSSEAKKSIIESEAVSSVMISSKAETAREEVQTSDRVPQTPRPPKDLTTVDITSSVFDSMPNDQASVERKPKSDLNISSEAGIKTEEKPLIKISQTPKELTTEIPNSGGNSTAKVPNSDLSSKESASEKTKSLVEHNTFKNNTLDDTDEIIDSEFIEVSTDSEASISKASQKITVQSSEKIEVGSTDYKEVRQTTMESSQATPLEECSPKDYTCTTEEGGRVLRCPESEGIFPYPGDERRFLKCKQNEIRVKFCPGHLIFSPAMKDCISKFLF